MALSKIHLASDEDFLEAYNNNTDYTNMARALGYGTNINNNVRVQIKERLESLNLPLYEVKQSILELTKGELFDKRKNYQSARGSIRKHAQIIYDKSDKPKCCIVCGYNNHYEVCHKKGVSEFYRDVDITTINDIDNLIALCPNHHWEYDNGILKL